MISRFKKSLGFIYLLQRENVYTTINEKEFNSTFLDTNIDPILIPSEEVIGNTALFANKYPFAPNPNAGFYEDTYASFRFLYEIDIILDQIEYQGISFDLAEELMNICGMLAVTTSNAMISLDDDFSMNKKYSLCSDIYIMTQNMRHNMLLYHSISNDKKLSQNHDILFTRFDEVENRLNCKYIKNGLSVVKLFIVLATLQVSPLYSDGVRNISKTLISILLNVLYNKRIIKYMVDVDIEGYNNKPRKTTRLKIYFAMSNSDRFCIRLDLPHEGEDSIHLNINQPAYKQSLGFPFTRGEDFEILDLCYNKSIFEKLFYEKDDLIWFRSNYSSVIKDLGKIDEGLYKRLDDFLHERSHIKICSSSIDNKKAVSDFSVAFSDAMIDYQVATNIYGSTDSDDKMIYQYMLFVDYMYDTVIRLDTLGSGTVKFL